MKQKGGPTQGQEIDLSGFPYRNVHIRTVDDLKKYILENPSETFVKSFLEKITTFALGREPHFYDRAFFTEIMRNTEPAGYKSQDILRAFIASELFVLHEPQSLR